MENFCRGMCWGIAAGLVVGGIVVAKNKNLSSKIRKGLGIAEEKMQEAKEFIEEKVDEIKTECEESGVCGGNENKHNFSDNCNSKDLNKKSKN